MTSTCFTLATSLLATLIAVASSTKFPHPYRPLQSPVGCGADGIECPTCTAAPRLCKDRVRRSWSTLTDDEKRRFFRAVYTMKNISTQQGQQLYGPQFHSYDDLLLQHAAAVVDPRGDQAHLDQHFTVFHRMFLLKFENSLLAVEPSLQGLPYWSLYEGVDAIFGSDELSFGSSTGTGPNHEVIDGALADWNVSPFDSNDLLEGSLKLDPNLLFSNATGTRLLRTSDVPTNRLVRYPTCDLTNDDVPSPLRYSMDDYETCVSQTTLEDFTWCLESPSTNAAHEFPHFWLGSADSDEYGFACPKFQPSHLKNLPMIGDYIDKVTSVNDPIFFLHHAFVDLLSMEFMRRNSDQADRYWGFKAAMDSNSTATEGTFLEDVISSAWPFQGSVLVDGEATGAPQGSTPLTYWEAMCWVGPETAIYTYDIFEDDVVCSEVEQSSSAFEAEEGTDNGVMDVFEGLDDMPLSTSSMAGPSPLYNIRWLVGTLMTLTVASLST